VEQSPIFIPPLCDFIAIIEIRDKAVLQRTEAMLESMGKDYDYQISDRVGRGVKERYAFLDMIKHLWKLLKLA